MLKKEFDIHRAHGTKHPLMKAYGVNAVAAIQTSYAIAPTFVRALLNSGTGTVVMTVVQVRHQRRDDG